MEALYWEGRDGLQELAEASSRQGTSREDRCRGAQELLLLLRDCSAFSLQWAAAVRAHSVGGVRAVDVQDQRGQSLLPQLRVPEFPFPAGYRWQLAPNGSKTVQARRAGSLPVEVLAEEKKHLGPLRFVHKLVQVWQEAMGQAGPADWAGGDLC